MRYPCALFALAAGMLFGVAPSYAQNVPLASGVAASFSYPQLTAPTQFTGDRGFRIEVPNNANRLEVRLEIPTGVQFAIGLKYGSDFQSARFDADNGGVGNQNPLVVTATSSPALRSGTYFVGVLLLSSPSPGTVRITATVTTVIAGGGSTGNTLLTSGVSASYSFPRVTSPTLFSGDFGFRIVVPQGATRLEVRLAIPNGVQFAIGLKFGSDFQGGRFDADNGAIGNENPVVVTTGSSPPLRAGTYFVGISILSAPGAVTGSITATVSSANAPAISVPATLDAGTTVIGESRDAMLTIRNIGNATLRITSLTSSRTEFRAVSPATPFDIAASGQQAVTIRYTPTAVGAFTATLSIVSNDAARPTTTVALSAGPGVGLSRTSITVTSAAGTNPPPQTFTIRNTGSGTLTYQLSSSQPWVSVSPSAGSSTGLANTVTVSINTQGLAAGVHTATVRIMWNTVPVFGVPVQLTITGSAPVAPGSPQVVSMSAAALVPGAAVAPASLAVAAGENLAAFTESATPPLSATLGGIALSVKDSAGVDRAAQLYLVSPMVVKYVVPEETAAGTATLRITAGDRTVATGQFQVESIAPGLFSAGGTGRGVALGVAVRTTADGVETSEPLADCVEECTARAIDLGAETDQVFLVLTGTGIRNAVLLAATIGGETAEVAGFSPDVAMPGIDVVKIRVPSSLVGSGDVDVELVADDQAANVVSVRVGGTPPAIVPQISAVGPESGAPGERIAELRVGGQYLTGATALEFAPAEGIVVSILRATRTSVTAEVTIAADAALGARTVRVVTATGTSNELRFSIQ